MSEENKPKEITIGTIPKGTTVLDTAVGKKYIYMLTKERGVLVFPKPSKEELENGNFPRG